MPNPALERKNAIRKGKITFIICRFNIETVMNLYKEKL